MPVIHEKTRPLGGNERVFFPKVWRGAGLNPPQPNDSSAESRFRLSGPRLETRRRRPSSLCRSPMTVTDVDISNARPARSPDTKAATDYLISSGCNAISITVDVDGAAISVGTKIKPDAVAAF